MKRKQDRITEPAWCIRAEERFVLPERAGRRGAVVPGHFRHSGRKAAEVKRCAAVRDVINGAIDVVVVTDRFPCPVTADGRFADTVGHALWRHVRKESRGPGWSCGGNRSCSRRCRRGRGGEAEYRQPEPD